MSALPLAYNGFPAGTCMGCLGEGWVETAAGVDACRQCVRRAEAAWREREQQRRDAMWEEHVNVAGRGSAATVVTLAARRGWLTLRVGRGALERMPWFRGGGTVAVMLGRGAEAGRLRVVRGGTHKLLTRISDSSAARLEKLAPVELPMACFEHMAPDAEHEAEGVAHRIDPGLLEVALPAWAAPRTGFAHGYFLPVSDLAGGVR